MGHKVQNLDKRHRELLRSLKPEDCISIIADILQERAMATGYVAEMREVFQIVAQLRASLPAPRHRACYETYKLQKAMSRMSLSTLAGYMTTKSPAEFVGGIKEAMYRAQEKLASETMKYNADRMA